MKDVGNDIVIKRNINDIANPEKNYYREPIMELIGQTGGKPLVLEGRYKHNNGRTNMCTFITIRPVIPGYRATTICNHINIFRDEVAEYINLDERNDREEYMFIVNPSIYMMDGNQRGGIHLDKSCGVQPIFFRKQYDDYLKREDFFLLYKWENKYIVKAAPKLYASLYLDRDLY